ncbi:MAG: 50S ribosomal protein L11 methyltransferase [Deltaproteobacteria bacterium]|nr:50S ribosomal protein L11 methyltransferase [Deltaproteobacteria bacterium]MBW2138880.1 50S ribosomal protein L11 methyltransferase [Deltaproteobacteria bacterium]
MAAQAKKRKGWFEIAISIDPIAHEATTAYLFDMGCEGVVFEDHPDPCLSAYMTAECLSEKDLEALGKFLESLQEIFPEIAPPKFQVREVPEEDWSLYWRQFFKPDLVTPQLMILPPWEVVPGPFEGIVVKIDPGPAFGTGRHPTTRLCLKAMERTAPKGRWTMIDVGTGSGILAIYGKMLGAERVLAIDTDPEATRWARRNIRLNGLAGSIAVSSKPLEEWEGPFSILVANLTFEIILDLLPFFPRLLPSGGTAILSGILETQVRGLLNHLNQHQLEPCTILREDDWACVIALKGGSTQGND